MSLDSYLWLQWVTVGSSCLSPVCDTGGTSVPGDGHLVATKGAASEEDSYEALGQMTLPSAKL